MREDFAGRHSRYGNYLYFDGTEEPAVGHINGHRFQTAKQRAAQGFSEPCPRIKQTLLSRGTEDPLQTLLSRGTEDPQQTLLSRGTEDLPSESRGQGEPSREPGGGV